MHLIMVATNSVDIAISGYFGIQRSVPFSDTRNLDSWEMTRTTLRSDMKKQGA